MPTGYTAKLMEKGQPFDEFVLQCARAFGACIMMRDDPMDTPIPDKFEPSDYYDKRIAETTAELDRLLAMNGKGKILFGNAKKAETVKVYEKGLARDTAENARLEQMDQQVQEWIPPSDEHGELKKFMLDQIKISKHDLNYSENSLKSVLEKLPLNYWRDAVDGAKRTLEYNKKERVSEIERADGRTRWVRQLRDSLDTTPCNASR